MTRAYEDTTTKFYTDELGACALVQDLLPLYLEGEVSPGSRDLITEHLGRCERCAGYLGGVQRGRALLRSGVEQRQTAIAQSQPATRKLSALSRMLGGVAVVLLCLFGVPPALFVGNGLFHAELGSLVVGLFFSLLILGLLAWLGRSYGPVSRARLLLLAGGCAMGGLGVIMVTAPFAGAAAAPGLIIGLIGVGAVWTAVLRREQSRAG